MTVRSLACAFLALLAVVWIPSVADADQVCDAGYETVVIAIENQSADFVTVSVRQARSEQPWNAVELVGRGSGDVMACLQMVLSVASVEYAVLDHLGATMCSESKFIPGGASVMLVVDQAGSCNLMVGQ